MNISLDDIIAEEMQDPEFAAAYRKMRPVFDVAHQVILLRQDKHMSQECLAEKVGTKQSSISRLENMSSTPSISFLQRIAEALDADLKIEFVSK